YFYRHPIDRQKPPFHFPDDWTIQSDHHRTGFAVLHNRGLDILVAESELDRSLLTNRLCSSLEEQEYRHRHRPPDNGRSGPVLAQAMVQTQSQSVKYWPLPV